MPSDKPDIASLAPRPSRQSVIGERPTGAAAPNAGAMPSPNSSPCKTSTPNGSRRCRKTFERMPPAKLCRRLSILTSMNGAPSCHRAASAAIEAAGPLLDRTPQLMQRSHPSSGRPVTPADINRNGRPTSIGTGGRHQSECPADITGIRSENKGTHAKAMEAGSRSRGTALTYQEAPRPLIRPDEISELREDVALIVPRKGRPLLCG